MTSASRQARRAQRRRLILPAIVTILALILPLSPASASPGGPDQQMHPYVGVIVRDLGNGRVDPDCHITLISSTEAVTANHCAPRGSQITFTLDNPVLVPAQLHTGTSRVGGFDYGDFDVDVAIVDLDAPVQLPRYAQVPAEPVTYNPGLTLDFVTYVGDKQSVLVSHGLDQGRPPRDKRRQNEPAHVEYDRNVVRTTASPNSPLQTDKTVVTNNPTCYGNSGSPIFPSGTDIIAAVLSSGPIFCTGGGDSYFARTDSELALGILNGTVPLPPPPTAYPTHVEGLGTSGMLSFPATVRAGAKYTGSVTGLTPATETEGAVDQDESAVFPVSVSPGFRSFLVALRNEYTSGGDDLDVYLIWYIDGLPYYFAFSGSPTSDETALLTPDLLQYVAFFGVDDLYNFEVWVYGYDTQGATAHFTLFTDELTQDDGNLTVGPTTAALDDPHVTIDLSWSNLDPAHRIHFGLIDHYLDGLPEPRDKSTYVEISVPSS
jgi:hypothetical protein